ncbi:MAG TPA: HIT domain-containing protein [Pontiellaceae bacterium]|nr:HIT domain-containing protein [Pontiellaceae bacterium]HPR83201.1 HIT domain-containing protein [Pontiellaceae bacterium]
MNRPLWAPWRVEYIHSEKNGECFLCRMFRENTDRKNLLLVRGKTCAVMLNRYPYNSGHLMVAPYRHIAEPAGLTPEENLEMAALTARAVDVLRTVMSPHGFNIGINLGEAAGAGLKDHLHQHIVPRWVGDTNFMPVLGGPRVIPEALEITYDLLLKSFNR